MNSNDEKTIGFANFVAYIIQREMDLADSLDPLSVESLVKNNAFGAGPGQGYGEHLILIKLHF